MPLDHCLGDKDVSAFPAHVPQARRRDAPSSSASASAVAGYGLSRGAAGDREGRWTS